MLWMLRAATYTPGKFTLAGNCLSRSTKYICYAGSATLENYVSLITRKKNCLRDKIIQKFMFDWFKVLIYWVWSVSLWICVGPTWCVDIVSSFRYSDVLELNVCLFLQQSCGRTHHVVCRFSCCACPNRNCSIWWTCVKDVNNQCKKEIVSFLAWWNWPGKSSRWTPKVVRGIIRSSFT